MPINLILITTILLQKTLADIPYLGLLLTIIGVLFGALVWFLGAIWSILKTRFTTVEGKVAILEDNQIKLSTRQDNFDLQLQMFTKDLMIKDLEKQNRELVQRLHK